MKFGLRDRTQIAICADENALAQPAPDAERFGPSFARRANRVRYSARRW
jgi:hypothetical protein